MTTQVFLGLGSNVGNRKEYLEKAINALENIPEITVTGISSVYETEPFGGVEQNKFLNMVIKIETTIMPAKLLEVIMAIEKDLDRVRTIRWGPRTIDIDILLYGDEVINTRDLTIPHIGLTERDFVLVPLLEIAPDIKLPSGEPLKNKTGGTVLLADEYNL
ncbi:2-amino-4-hydroxy-6-hydroxymethyldihydropteridine diphosphokinase [Desulfitibacter alkalitolerans]|uniref:2-amino-4-hydroxy-6- hydroxymethyldihydropteridine diphosphokinase n=1 Tax=Desulfitibacter alkalitolerans TaxID=264641 RepID=UPI0004874C7F|nr:2-amino-4-hydroxy-6-hydroxymethyldihydropteridine diphosphokinase [Desulfitibacter alkalitolerans]